MYSTNKDFNRFVDSLVKSGKWSFIPKGGRKHAALKHINGSMCPVPTSPGKHPRGLLNFRSMIRKIENT